MSGAGAPSEAERGGPRNSASLPLGRFFYFFYFLFSFFTKIYFRFANLQEYTPAARQPGGRGISEKKFRGENCAQVPGGRLPGSGAAGRNFCNLALFAKEFHICALL